MDEGNSVLLPSNHDVWRSYVHENATVLFVDSKASAYTLAAIMQYAGIVDSTPKYWHYTAEASEFHHADFFLLRAPFGQYGPVAA